MLFSDSDDSNIFKDKMHLCENFEESVRYLEKHRPIFDDYEHFLKACFNENRS